MSAAYGRHIVVSFDNVNAAEQFAKALKVEGAVYFMGDDGHFTHVTPDEVRVLGMFGKPNRFCECSWSDGEKKYVRGLKYGLYVHDKCLRPEGGHMQTAPRNLLYPDGLGTRERANMEGYVSLSVREGQRRWPEPNSTKKREADEPV